MKNDIKKLYKKDPKLAIQVAKALGYRVEAKSLNWDKVDEALDYIFKGMKILKKEGKVDKKFFNLVVVLSKAFSPLWGYKQKGFNE